MRVLLSETNWNSMAAAAGLVDAGLLVTRVNDGREMMDFAEFGEQSAIVLDLDMPDMDGCKLIEHMRQRNPLIPIYVLSETENWDVRKKAYAMGADDVIYGPVNAAALAAQIKAAVRRTAGYSSKDLTIGPLILDTHHGIATLNGRALHLTRKEYEILEMLSLHRERLVTREAFMNHLYAWDDEPDARIINVYLSRIRQQIDLSGGEPDMVQTVWGLGYRIVSEPAAQQAA
ncbi:MAG: response regulator transcription factor [Alphaproteobacteria bacterium]|nr:response regulator transcription factor [Alphaproteobacteria bacterium]MBU1281499.1 response regulator transcription factor [Alphaproteobacteria bacterium]MBU1572400.1 response regulator transcription factor [Alphaproteobacteria bacterium]MBU1828436.1 response regulator transcription factor [Alphaproteobacteria bacterium]MBU2077919.1 response regulator transcription factor [Alphaproteobacteria bacterium]